MNPTRGNDERLSSLNLDFEAVVNKITKKNLLMIRRHVPLLVLEQIFRSGRDKVEPCLSAVIIFFLKLKWLFFFKGKVVEEEVEAEEEEEISGDQFGESRKQQEQQQQQQQQQQKYH